MNPKIATMLCNVAGHPGLRKMARDVKNSGRASALLFWKCPRCGVEIRSIEVEQPRTGRTTRRPAYE
jgi:hypothetical protein